MSSKKQSQREVNREGLTFEEWVCAAGVAAFSGESVRPYSSSSQSYTFIGLTRPDPNLIRLDTPTPARYLLKPIRRTTRYYSEKIRKAWRDGEDPSEYRAQR